MKANGELEPILVASGGGGLGPGPYVDNGIQHGYGPFSRNLKLPTHIISSEDRGD